MTSNITSPPLEDHLRAMLGADATFRAGQREAIEAVIEDGSRALVVQRTGWGKSLVYWIATRVRRDQGHGPALIVSPLLALMRNQIAMAARLGLEAVTINSGNVGEWKEIEERLGRDEIDVLLISPERLANEGFVTRVLPSIQSTIGLLVIDEAHCISDWGHDFRPDYRRISRLLPLLGPAVPVLATTATANDRVVDDVAAQLGEHVAIIRGPLARDTLRLDAIRLNDQAERLAWLAENLPRLPGSGIVYCLTVADTERVAGFLQLQGIDARAYSGPMNQPDREALEDALIANEMKALVATVALGMGFDKPDLGFVVHYQRPGSAIAYYQQVGRAGRAVDRAYGILLAGREDDEIADYFLRTAFPPADRMRELLATLEAAESATLGTLQKAVNLSRNQIDQALKLLEIDGAVTKIGGRFHRTDMPWEPDDARIARVIATRRARAATDARLRHPRGLPHGVPHPAPRRPGGGAVRSLRERRRQGDAARGFAGRRPSGHRLPPPQPSADRAAEAVGRGGCRRPARRSRSRTRRGSRSASTATRGGGGTSKRRGGAAGVSRMPSSQPLSGRSATSGARIPPRSGSRPFPRMAEVRSVVAFGAALAAQLGLPFVESITAAADGQPQGNMQNSVQQLTNARSKLGVEGSAVLPGPVLLVDDIVDSRWTMTVAGSLLREHGSGPVHPFALAAARSSDG